MRIKKKTIVMLVLILAMTAVFAELNPPEGLTAFSDFDGFIPLSWEEPEPVLETLTEIAFDSGSGNDAETSVYGETIDQRFEIEDPCTLFGFTTQYYLFGTWPESLLTCEVYIYDDVLGGPDRDSVITSQEMRFRAPAGWMEFYFDEPVLVEDDFHIAIKKSDTLINDPSVSFMFYHDTVPSTDPSRAKILGGMYATEIEGDLRLRAVVRYLGETACDSFMVLRYDDPEGVYRPIARLGREYEYTDSGTVNHHSYYYKFKARFGDLGWGPVSDSVYGMSRGGAGLTFYDTLKLDAGTPIGGATWHPRYRFAMKHTAPTTSLLYKLLFHFDTGEGEYKPAIYEFKDGMPAEDSLFIWPFSVPCREGWNSQNIYSENIYVDQEFIVSCNIMNSDLAMSWGFPTEPNVAFDYDFGEGSWSSVTDTAYFIQAIIKYQTDIWNIKLYRGWNMVSMPVIPEGESTPEALFPSALPSSCYRYDPRESAYNLVDDSDPLEFGYGYWVYSLEDTSYQITGRAPSYNYDIPVYTGWNMIGSVASYPNVGLEYSEYFGIDSTASIIGGVLHWYDPVSRSYGYGTDEISAGKGYWGLFNQDGVFRIDSRRLMRARF